MKTTGAFTILILWSASACAPLPPPLAPGAPTYKPFTVVLQPKYHPGVLEVKTGNQGCTHGTGAKLGCVRFGTNEIGTITFTLFREDSGDRCDPEGDADWVITRIELSAQGNPDTEKGVFGGPQPDWLVDAFPGTRQSDGMIYEATTATGATTVAIFDQNNHTSERYVYYQVTAAACDDKAAPVQIDPMIENTGR